MSVIQDACCIAFYSHAGVPGTVKSRLLAGVGSGASCLQTQGGPSPVQFSAAQEFSSLVVQDLAMSITKDTWLAIM